MRPILSATDSYNFKLAEWLKKNLNHLNLNNAFRFAVESRDTHKKEDKILASYDVTSLFTNVFLKEPIGILAKKPRG